MMDLNRGSVKRWSGYHEVTSLGPHPQGLFSLEEGVRTGQMQLAGHIGRGSVCSHGERSQRRAPCSHFDLRFQPPEL